VVVMAKNDQIEDLQPQLDMLKKQLEMMQSDAAPGGDATTGGSQAGVFNYCDVGDGGGYAYDFLIVGTKKVIPPSPRTSFFLKIPHDGSAAIWVGAMPDVQDTDATTIDIRRVRFYLPGEIVG